MNAPFLTRNRAEAYLAANRTPQPAELQAFLNADPRPLPCAPAPAISPGLRTATLYLIGAMALSLLGWALQ